jgi:hypothetical protein
MKHFLTTILALLSFHCFGQESKDPLDQRPPILILQTGIGFQWLGDSYKLYTLSVERPKGYWHLGVQGTVYLNSQADYYYYSTEFLSGFEMGGFAKYFLHGRFSGRKSGLFLGPELRFGTRKFRLTTDIFFPAPPVPTYLPYEERITKILLRWGIQWQFGHASLELSAPFGVETYKSTLNISGYGNNHETRFVMLPGLHMGYAF